ncbi:hypothetical protein EPH_0057860 [Eimeria praecox]|uniref:Uncharacterized protein n=1 Tax=Eimeria praecox TaxID=51316 RepID=U6GZF6_9EIME|nr:hypothetical protein EPH_0057860 [Eimeria praecox]
MRGLDFVNVKAIKRLVMRRVCGRERMQHPDNMIVMQDACKVKAEEFCDGILKVVKSLVIMRWVYDAYKLDDQCFNGILKVVKRLVMMGCMYGRQG